MSYTQDARCTAQIHGKTIMRKTREISRSFCTFIYTDCALAGIEVFSPKDSVTTNFFSSFKKRLPTSTLNLILLDMVQQLLQLPLHTGKLLIPTPQKMEISSIVDWSPLLTKHLFTLHFKVRTIWGPQNSNIGMCVSDFWKRWNLLVAGHFSHFKTLPPQPTSHVRCTTTNLRWQNVFVVPWLTLPL